MSIKNALFKIFNGSAWDEYHFKTNSGQVSHTPEDGEETTVKDALDDLNRKLSGRLRSLGFTAGSTVVTRNGNLASIISSASIDSTFGVTGSNETNTAVFLSNGDGLTNDTDITSQYRDGNWYAKFSGGSNGAVRINYMVVRWNLS